VDGPPNLKLRHSNYSKAVQDGEDDIDPEGMEGMDLFDELRGRIGCVLMFRCRSVGHITILGPAPTASAPFPRLC